MIELIIQIILQIEEEKLIKKRLKNLIRILNNNNVK